MSTPPKQKRLITEEEYENEMTTLLTQIVEEDFLVTKDDQRDMLLTYLDNGPHDEEVLILPEPNSVITKKSFVKNEVVCQYRGELIVKQCATQRITENKAKGQRSYMYVFSKRFKQLCIDATDDVFDNAPARYIRNATSDQPSNVKMVQLLHNEYPKALVVARVDIPADSELFLKYRNKKGNKADSLNDFAGHRNQLDTQASSNIDTTNVQGGAIDSVQPIKNQRQPIDTTNLRTNLQADHNDIIEANGSPASKFASEEELVNKTFE